MVKAIDWNNVVGVVFSGGADISPDFYGRTADLGTHCSSLHDALDRAVLDAIAGLPIKKMGTCRGAQLLWADSEKAQIVQHIPSHFGDHDATVVATNGQKEDDRFPLTFNINSIHHQACIWDSWEPQNSDSRPPRLLQSGIAHGQTAVEAWVNTDRGNLGFQWHPEWVPTDSHAFHWFSDIVKAFFIEGDSYADRPPWCPLGLTAYAQYRVDLSDEVRNQCLANSL